MSEGPTAAAALPSRQAREALREVFGFDAFRPGQAEVVAAAEAGRDVLLVAPTGAGKSIGYWVPGVAASTLTLVVSPLIALMNDQVQRLRSLGIPAAALHSQAERPAAEVALDAAAADRLRFLYVTPERFAVAGFAAALARLRVGRLVVDEAHCISSWGHDFRPDYRTLRQAAELCGRPPIGAFTATATPRVRADIVASLGMRDPEVRVSGFVRPELHLAVQRCRGVAEKRAALVAALGDGPGRAIVYCGRVRGTVEMAEMLRSSGLRAQAYSGDLDAEQRHRVHDGFIRGDVDVVVATSAFGMGIDLPDIRAVVHLDIPGSIEQYYQEVGRAGRDGRPARCTLLYSPADRDLQEFFIAQAYPERDTVRAVYRAMLRAGRWGQEWAQAVPGVEPAAARAAVELLRRAGVLGEGGEVARLRASPVDFEEQALLRDNAVARLNQVMDYARSQACRHARIADYFGEEGTARTCASCDNCGSPRAPRRRVPAGDAAAALACVARFDGHLGASRVAALLTGADDSWVRQRPWVRQASFFGALRGWTVEAARDLLSALLEDGWLRRSSGERPVLALTDRGRRAACGEVEASVDLALPVIAPGRTTGRGGERGRRGGDGTAPGGLDPAAAARLDRLRRWRRETAGAAGLPAYVVFDDRTLRALAERHPDSAAAMLAVPGVGPAKLARYGAEVLSLLSQD